MFREKLEKMLAALTADELASKELLEKEKGDLMHETEYLSTQPDSPYYQQKKAWFSIIFFI